ncbi:flagellar basal body P-ring formation chaperone FlgA [Halobacteriovorax sp. XZX-3]|uniref:flagellar basal body P-ring formation chaperone FlgA n=1 Tax=unclassified Halobacteriovorax TaxID=2639665 RepID=UPI000CD09689|nr:flagellar basal body P-ring formation chaperone FlgA [Halobacteriovorax sp. DA5]POB13310.1 flagella basal body P-ring formation protein FlgA [Halobacteriovorax sp. DA5]
MFKLILLTFITSFSYANSCEISLAQKNYRVENSEIPYESQNCNRSQLEILNEMLISARGNFYLNHSRDLKQNDINLLTKDSVIIDLEDIVKTQFTIQDDWKVNFKSRSPIKTLQTDNLTTIELMCNECNKLGHNKLKVSVDGVAKWFEIIVQKPIKAIVAKNEIGLNFKSINTNNVEEKTIYTTDEKAVFKNLEEIAFYKSNKIISPGETINKRDLSPINLVSFGVPVKVILNTNGIKLTGQALPMSTGKLQDFIKVKNIKTNKVFTAKVIGLNEVKVDL